MSNDDQDDQTDIELLKQWNAGNRKSGKILCKRYCSIIRKFFSRKVSDAAQDLTQTTLEALAKNIGRLEKQSSFRAFVFAIARNVLLHHFRSRRRSRIDFRSDEVSCEDLGAGPFELVVGNERQRLLVRALRKIPIDHQIVIELHYWEELNSREIGEVLGVPSSTIRERRRRAKTRLREQLEQMLDGHEKVENTLMGLKTWRADVRNKMGTPVDDEPGNERPLA